jgi:hypothetical protein
MPQPDDEHGRPSQSARQHQQLYMPLFSDDQGMLEYRPAESSADPPRVDPNPAPSKPPGERRGEVPRADKPKVEAPRAHAAEPSRDAPEETIRIATTGINWSPPPMS